MNGQFWKDYVKGEKIGKGGFAEVFLAYSNKLFKNVAVKVINKAELAEKRLLEKIKEEKAIHSALRHSRIVELLDSREDHDNFYLVLEYCPGDVRKYLNQRKDYDGKFVPLDLSEVARIFAQVVDGVIYLHQQGIIHRDLSPSNILLDQNNDVKICDFGLATRMKQLGENQYTVVGTPAFMSPEVSSKNGYDMSADFWSLGCLLYYLLAKDTLASDFRQDASNNGQQRLEQCRNKVKLNEHLPHDAKDLILALLEPAKKRLKGYEIKKHPFLAQYYSQQRPIPGQSVASFDSGRGTYHSALTSASHRPMIRSAAHSSRSLDRGNSRRILRPSPVPPSAWSDRQGYDDAVASAMALPVSQPGFDSLVGLSISRFPAYQHGSEQNVADSRQPLRSHDSRERYRSGDMHRNEQIFCQPNTGVAAEPNSYHQRQAIPERNAYAATESSNRSFHCPSFRALGHCGGTCQQQNNASLRNSQSAPKVPSLHDENAMHAVRSGCNQVAADTSVKYHQSECCLRSHHSACCAANNCKASFSGQVPTEHAAAVGSQANNRSSCSERVANQNLSCNRYPSNISARAVPSNQPSAAQYNPNESRDQSAAESIEDDISLRCKIRNDKGETLYDVARPISTKRLRRPQLKSSDFGMILLFANGDVAFETKIKDSQNLAGKAMRVTSDGLKIFIYRPKRRPGSSLTQTLDDVVWERWQEEWKLSQTFAYTELPADRFRYYSFIAEHVEQMKEITVKISGYYPPDAKCHLYENGKFTVNFYGSGRTYTKEPKGEFVCSGQQASSELEHCKRYLDACNVLELSIERTEQAFGLCMFPAQLGNRPTPASTKLLSNGNQGTGVSVSNKENVPPQSAGSQPQGSFAMMSMAKPNSFCQSAYYRTPSSLASSSVSKVPPRQKENFAPPTPMSVSPSFASQNSRSAVKPLGPHNGQATSSGQPRSFSPAVIPSDKNSAASVFQAHFIPEYNCFAQMIREPKRGLLIHYKDTNEKLFSSTDESFVTYRDVQGKRDRVIRDYTRTVALHRLRFSRHRSVTDFPATMCISDDHMHLWYRLFQVAQQLARQAMFIHLQNMAKQPLI